MADKVDMRVLRTHKNIERAFIDLLGQKRFEQITVQNILDEALINRKTFYKYYEDKYNLANILIERSDERFAQALDERFRRVKRQCDVSPALRDFYGELFKQRREILALSTIKTADRNLLQDYKELLKQAYRKSLGPVQEGADPREIDYLSEMYTATSLASIMWALNTGDPSSIDVVCKVSLANEGDENPQTGFMSIGSKGRRVARTRDELPGASPRGRKP